MRFSDAISGLLVLALGLAVAGYAQTFPPMPGQNVGPSLFPTMVGGGLALFGLILATSGRGRRDGAHVRIDDWMCRPALVRNGALVLAALVFYIAAADVLGFFVTAIVFLIGLWLSFGARRRWLAPLALIVAGAIHYSFYTVLGVPLPWGVFEPLAW